MQMQMAGSPVQMPEMKNTRCVTPEDAKDPSRTLFREATSRAERSSSLARGRPVWKLRVYLLYADIGLLFLRRRQRQVGK